MLKTLGYETNETYNYSTMDIELSANDSNYQLLTSLAAIALLNADDVDPDYRKENRDRSHAAGT